MDIIIDGCKEKQNYRLDEFNESRSLIGMTKEDLANKPLRYLLEQMQIWIEISFDPQADSFTLSYLGIDVEKIQKVELSKNIFKHKVIETSTRNLIRYHYHTIYRNMRYVTTAIFHLKTKRC